MVKIRADLDGVVYVHSDGADVTMLKAGDDIPDGYTVGDHLLDEPTEPEHKDGGGDGTPGAPRGNMSRDAWAEYAASLGIEVPDDATRNEIKALTAPQD